MYNSPSVSINMDSYTGSGYLARVSFCVNTGCFTRTTDKIHVHIDINGSVILLVSHLH